MRDKNSEKYQRQLRADAHADYEDRERVRVHAELLSIAVPTSAVVDYQALRDASGTVDDDEDA